MLKIYIAQEWTYNNSIVCFTVRVETVSTVRKISCYAVGIVDIRENLLIFT